MESTDSNTLLRLWPLIMMEVSELEKEKDEKPSILNKFLAKYLNLIAEDCEVPDLPLNASNELCRVLLFDINSLPWRLTDKEPEGQLQDYFLKERGWKLLRLLLHLKAKNLSYEYELAKILSSILMDLVELSNWPSDVPVKLSKSESSVTNEIRKDCESMSSSNSLISKFKMQRIEMKHIRKHKRFKVKSIEAVGDSLDGNNSDSDECHPPSLHFTSPVISSPIKLLKNPFEYYSLQNAKSESEDEEDEMKFDDSRALQQMLLSWEEDTKWSISPVDLSRIVVDLLIIIYNQYSRTRLQKSHLQNLVASAIELFNFLLMPSWKPEGWTDRNKNNIRHSVLNLLYCITTGLISCSPKLDEAFVNTIDILLSSALKFGENVNLSCHLSCDSYLASVCLLNQVMKKGHFSEEEHHHFIQTIRMFTNIKFCKLLAKITHQNFDGRELISLCVKEYIKMSQLVLSKLQHLSFKIIDSSRSKLQYHHHVKVLGEPSQTCSNEDTLCIVTAVTKSLMGLFALETDPQVSLAILDVLNYGGICCCITPAGLVEGFRNGLFKTESSVCHKAVLVMERLINNISLKSCQYCDVSETWNDEAWLTNYWSLYKNLLLSADYSQSNELRHFLLRLIECKKEEHKLYILNYVALPLFDKGKHNHAADVESDTLEFSLMVLSKLLEHKMVVKDFLKIFPTEDFKSLLSVRNTFNSIILDILKNIIWGTSKEKNPEGEHESIHPGAVSIVNNILLKCNVDSLLLIIEKRATNYEECIEELDFTYKAWATCKVLLQCNSYRSLFLSSDVLGIVYQLFLEILKHFQKESNVESPDLNCPDIKIVQLLEATLSVCLNLVPFYDIPMAKQITELEVIKLTAQSLNEWIPNNIRKLRHLYDSLFLCFMGETQRHFAPSNKNWTSKGSETTTIDSFQADIVDSEDDISAELVYNADVDTEDEMITSNTFEDCAQDCKRILYPSVLGLTLKLLTNHIEKLATANGNSAGKLDVALHIIQRLIGLCFYEGHSCAIIMKQQEALQMVYRLLTASSTWLSLDTIEFQHGLIKLWSNIVIKGGVSANELVDYLKMFNSTYVSILGPLLDGFCSVLNNSKHAATYTVKFPVQFSSTENNINLEKYGIRKDLTQYNLGELDFSHSENISLDLPLAMWHILGNRMTSELEIKSVPPWNVVGAIMPLVHDTDWTPRHKNGFSISMWIKMQCFGSSCSNSNDEALEIQHVISIGSDFWLMEIWLDFKNHSFIIYITEATKKEYICLRKSDFDFPLKLESNKLHHLIITYSEIESVKGKYSNAKISLTLDGFMSSNPVPTFCLNKSKQHHRASYILIGHSVDKEIATSNMNSFEIGNVFIFKSLVLQLNHCFLLYCLGPCIENLTEGLLDSFTFNFLNLSIEPKMLGTFFKSGLQLKEIEDTSYELLQTLREHFFVSYNPRRPLNYMVYPHVMDFKEMFLPMVPSSHHSNFRVVTNDHRPTQQYPIDLNLTCFGEFNRKHHQSIFSSIQHLGGGNLFLFWFAKMVEMSDDEQFQSQSLQLLLKLLNKMPQNQYRRYLYTTTSGNISASSFEEMLKYVFENPKCLTRSRMLLVLVNESLSSPLLSLDILKKGSCLDINTRVDSVILHPWIIAVVITSWCAFEEAEDSHDIITLFQCLNALVSVKQPFRKFNIQQLLRIDIIQRISSFLKEKVLNSQTPIQLELGIALSDLIRDLLSEYPNLELLECIWGALVVLHPQDFSFISYKPGNSYFSMPSSHKDFSESSNNSIKSSNSSDISTDIGVDEHLLIECEAIISKESKLIANLRIKDSESSNDVLEPKESIVMSENIAIEDLELSSLPLSGEPGEVILELSKLEENYPITNDSTTKDEFGRDEGLQAFICGLYNVFYQLLLTMPESAVPLNLPKNFQMETTLLLSNHPHMSVRCSALMLLAAQLQRISSDQVEAFLKENGFQLLTNQLHQFSVDQSLLDACGFLALRHIKEKHSVSPEEFGLNTSFNLLPEQVSSSIALLGVLVNSSSDLDLAHNALGYLTQAIQIVQGANYLLLENGLIEVVCCFITKVTHKDENTPVVIEVSKMESVIVDILDLLRLIAKKLVRSHTLENSCSLLHNGITQLTKNYILSLEQCGHESLCVKTFRDCVCALISESLSSMEISLESAGRILSRAEAGHMSSIANIPLYEKHGSSAFLNSKWTDQRRSQSYAGNLSSQEFSPVEVLEKYCQLVAVANDFLTHREPNCIISNLELDFSTALLLRMLDELEGNLASGHEVPKFYRRVAVLKDTSSELSKLLLWLLSPYSTINKRLEVVNLLVSRWKHEEIIGAVLRHMTQHISQQFLAFLYDLLYRLEHRDESTDSNVVPQSGNVTKSSLCQSIYQLIDDVIKWYGRSMTCLDNEIIEKAIHLWYENAYRDRCLWHAKIRIMARRLEHGYFQLDKELAGNAIKITSNAVEYQNAQRKLFMTDLKRSLGRKMEAEKCWHIMRERLTHEKSIWHDSSSYPVSWQLDPTEGPQRTRRRLQRCHVKVAAKFIMPDYQTKLETEHHPQPLSYLFNNDESSSGSAALVEKLHSDERIIYHCTCLVVTPAIEVSGEILIGEKCIHFIREKSNIPFDGLGSHPAQVWLFEDILEVQLRRFQLQDNALEIFLTSGHTHLVAFPSPKARDDFSHQLFTNTIPNIIAPEQISIFTEKWRQRQLSNFEYLTQLNKLAGRSFNDLMQYPVFPFILANYVDNLLDLNDSKSYRDLSKPMAVQDPRKEDDYIKRYNDLKKEHEFSKGSDDMLMPTTGPYHYGSHYSNSGTVLHFLVRIPPFTQMFLTYQDNHFDIPDRTFHSLHTSWRLASSDSSTDVKELIPEFFFLPEFLVNYEGFDFGVRQSGERVNHIILPPWSSKNARQFILIHRQALESDFVRNTLSKWIDLVFGYKQTGKAAIEAINVFHPATYYGMDPNIFDDPLKKNAIMTMIRTFGQMPKQLFYNSHPVSSSGSYQFLTLKQEPTSVAQVQVLKEVKGLQWGSYVGSPSGSTPIPSLNSQHALPIANLVPLVTNDIYGLAANTCLFLSYSKEKGVLNTTFVTAASLVTWGHVDGVIRIKLKRDSSPLPLLADKTTDPVTICATVPDCNLLFIGRSSGNIDVHLLDLQTGQNRVRLKGPTISLLGHRNKITNLYISKAFNILASSCQDGEIVIWDLNSLNYIRSLSDRCKVPISCLCVSETLGDIASVKNIGATSTQCSLSVHTVNGHLVGQVTLPVPITAICYSTAPEGLSVNVIATGLANGCIRLWSSWNLECVREIRHESCVVPISSLAYSLDNQYLYVCYSDGQVIVYHKASKISRAPRFLTVL